MLAAIAILTALGLGLGALLGVAARYLKMEQSPIIGTIEALLPGANCGQCGYPGCTPAAEALAAGGAPATLCPPGGRVLAEELARLLNLPLDRAGAADKPLLVAHIHERLCIGCTKCLKRCPTDAIIGANDQIHAVFEDACIGCEKCFGVCPTECIEMRPATATIPHWYWPLPATA